MSDFGGAAVGRLVRNFYSTPRASAGLLSDGGGPFGFDVHVALQIDCIIRLCGIDGIVETGCCLGDTTEYLARQYPRLAVRTCDIDSDRAAFTDARLQRWPNVTVGCGDSAELITDLSESMTRPLYILDAHGGSGWPLADELYQIARGVAAIDDFDIGHPRFSYDVYDDVPCSPALIAAVFPHLRLMLVGNPYGSYPVPCLQPYRRSGVGYLNVPPDVTRLWDHDFFCRIDLSPIPSSPDWSASEHDYLCGRRRARHTRSPRRSPDFSIVRPLDASCGSHGGEGG